ncbi:MAG: hypothetical protein FWG82_03240 [Oscillospiraceae bacterium]|nr:hypothetical protein [Oscillospiraceae bacterium]
MAQAVDIDQNPQTQGGEDKKLKFPVIEYQQEQKSHNGGDNAKDAVQQKQLSAGFYD